MIDVFVMLGDVLYMGAFRKGNGPLPGFLITENGVGI